MAKFRVFFFLLKLTSNVKSIWYPVIKTSQFLLERGQYGIHRAKLTGTLPYCRIWIRGRAISLKKWKNRVYLSNFHLFQRFWWQIAQTSRHSKNFSQPKLMGYLSIPSFFVILKPSVKTSMVTATLLSKPLSYIRSGIRWTLSAPEWKYPVLTENVVLSCRFLLYFSNSSSAILYHFWQLHHKTLTGTKIFACLV